MANRYEGLRDDEKLGVKAFEKAEDKRFKEGEKLTAKVEPVNSAVKDLEGAHKEASASLEKFKGGKKEVAEIKEKFRELIKNPDVHALIADLIEEKRQQAEQARDKNGDNPRSAEETPKGKKLEEGEQMFMDYMKFVGVEEDDSGLVKEYSEADEKLKSLRAELKSAVGRKASPKRTSFEGEGFVAKEIPERKASGRAGAKDKLLAELQKNNPEYNSKDNKEGDAGIRTFGALKAEAGEQTNLNNPESIINKEIRGYVDGLVEAFKAKLPEVVLKYSENPNGNFSGTFRSLFSEGDVTALQKYGPRYSQFAEGYFLARIKEEAAKIFSDPQVNTVYVEQTKNYTSERRRDAQESMTDKIIGENWKDTSRSASAKRDDMNKLMWEKKYMETFERTAPEVDGEFSDFEKAVAPKGGEYTYSGAIKTFENRYDGMVVEFESGQDNTVQQKYLNFEYPDSRKPNGVNHHGFMGLKNLENNLGRLDADLVEEQRQLGILEDKKTAFDRKGFFGKLGKSQERVNIMNRLGPQREKVKQMQAAQKILTGVRDLMAGIHKIQEVNKIELATGVVRVNGPEGVRAFKDAIQGSLKKRLGQ